MASIQDDVVIAASADRVWEVLRDVGRLPEMSASTVAVEVDGPLERVGQEFRQTVSFAGRTSTSTWRVEGIDPGQHLDISGALPAGVAYGLSETLEPLGAERTRLTIRADYVLPGGVLGRLVDRLGVERRARAEVGEVLRGVASAAEGGVAG